MSKYTPGKWWVAPAYPSIGGKMVCAASQTESSPYTVVAMYIENQADTCLIAAAPEMYRMMKNLLGYVREWEAISTGTKYKAKVREDIHKAEALVARIDGKDTSDEEPAV